MNIESTLQENEGGYQKLRESVHEDIENKTKHRIIENPVPTENEIRIGAFSEMLEPQVRDAIFTFQRKGYSCESSGFGGEFGETQQLDGFFTIDEPTKKKLESMGVSVEKDEERGLDFGNSNYTFLSFRPESLSIDDIKNKWDKIAEILPDLNKSAEPSILGSATEEFYNTFAHNIAPEIERKYLERMLKIIDMHPDNVKKHEQRLTELKNMGY